MFLRPLLTEADVPFRLLGRFRYRLMFLIHVLLSFSGFLMLVEVVMAVLV
jgi:hypothetical protein